MRNVRGHHWLNKINFGSGGCVSSKWIKSNHKTSGGIQKRYWDTENCRNCCVIFSWLTRAEARSFRDASKEKVLVSCISASLSTQVFTPTFESWVLFINTIIDILSKISLVSATRLVPMGTEFLTGCYLSSWRAGRRRLVKVDTQLLAEIVLD